MKLPSALLRHKGLSQRFHILQGDNLLRVRIDDRSRSPSTQFMDGYTKVLYQPRHVSRVLNAGACRGAEPTHPTTFGKAPFTIEQRSRFIEVFVKPVQFTAKFGVMPSLTLGRGGVPLFECGLENAALNTRPRVPGLGDKSDIHRLSPQTLRVPHFGIIGVTALRARTVQSRQKRLSACAMRNEKHDAYPMVCLGAHNRTTGGAASHKQQAALRERQNWHR